VRKQSLGFVLAVGVLLACTGVSGEEKTVDGVRLRWGISEIPERVTSFRSPLAGRPAERYGAIPAPEFVPLGAYGGDFGDATWDYRLSDITSRYGNSYYVNGSHQPYPPGTLVPRTAEGLKALCRRAARLGVRIYYQDQSSPLSWPTRITHGPPREQVYRRASAWVKEVVPQFASDPELRAGLLAWGITEEIDAETAREPLLKKLKEQIERADPYHPPLVLIMPHTSGVQDALFESWGRIPIVVTDHYLNHRGLNRRGISGFNLRRLKLWSDLARQEDSRFWLVVACFSMFNDLDPSVKEGHRILAPQEVRMSLWTGLVHGASGFWLFHQYDNDGTGRACLTRFDWQPTEEYVAASRFFRRVRRLSPLVGEWKMTGEVTLEDGVAAGRFRHPDYKGTFIVLVNPGAWKSVSYRCEGTLYELEGFTPVRGELELAGGEGVVLFEGGASELDALKVLLGPGLHPVLKEKLNAERAQVWKTNEESDGFAQKRDVRDGPIGFGGKGAMPVIYRSNLPGWKGKLLDWGEGVKVPARVYYPPRPGAGETVFYLKWDLAELAGCEVDRAVLKLGLASAVPGGRLGVYPVVDEGPGTGGVIEYMPRWEDNTLGLKAGQELEVEITGIVGEWASGELANRGLLLVYEGFPSPCRQLTVETEPALEVQYVP